MTGKDCDLPKGWTRIVRVRAQGATAGRIDVYYKNSEGKTFRSGVELRDYFGKSFDLTGFQYAIGRFKSTKEVSRNTSKPRTKITQRSASKPRQRGAKRRASPVKPLKAGSTAKSAKAAKVVVVASAARRESSAKKRLFSPSPKKIKHSSKVDFAGKITASKKRKHSETVSKVQSGTAKNQKTSGDAAAAVEEDPTCELPGGLWTMKNSTRGKGKRKGKVDVTYINHDTGAKFRSKASLVKHFGSTVDLSEFDFATGCFMKETVDKEDSFDLKIIASDSSSSSSEILESSEEDSPNCAAVAANGDDEKSSEDGSGKLCELPKGWSMKKCVRTKGKSAGKVDVTYTGPTNQVFRSKKLLKAHFAGLGTDLTDFDFKSGRFDKASS